MWIKNMIAQVCFEKVHTPREYSIKLTLGNLTVVHLFSNNLILTRIHTHFYNGIVTLISITWRDSYTLSITPYWFFIHIDKTRNKKFLDTHMSQSHCLHKARKRWCITIFSPRNIKHNWKDIHILRLNTLRVYS